MSKQQAVPAKSEFITILIAALLAGVGLAYFAGYHKILTFLVCICAVILLLRCDLSNLWNIPALLFLFYLTINGLSRFWAISGKFFLREYSELFTSGVLFLAVMLYSKFNRQSMRGTLKLFAWVSAIYSVLSVEAATTGFSKTLLTLLLPNYETVLVGFESGTRLTGIIGNANVLSSVLAFGILSSICLLCGEENGGKRIIYAGLAGINAFVFLLLFSMGGTACFALSVLFYLIFSGKGRSGVLVRMLECAIPTVVWVFVSFPFFNRPGGAVFVPLCAMVGNILTVILLEKVLGSRMTDVLSRHSKLTLGVFAGVVALACAYIVLGVTLTGAHTFEGEALRRGAYPAAGEHTLSIEASSPVNVTIVSQNMSQIMMHEETRIYHGSAENAVFTVPENSEVCYFTFTAEAGTVLETAALDSRENLKLNYTLLPGFIANRLQGLFANQNAIQRTVFFRDGMKMFHSSPIIGNGVGSFETGITSVQDFLYTTKYIHNHYIQVLLESGIVGFLPYLGSLLCMVWLLVRHRKESEQWEFQTEYPALWACFVMTLTHTMVELSMSVYAFNWMAFVLFALVIRCCAPAQLRLPVLDGMAGRAVLTALPTVFLLSVGLNIAAGRIASSSVRSIDEYFDNMELIASIDPYEANDAKLSYVIQTINEEKYDKLPTANEYAEDLLRQQSNTIPAILLEYYLATEQYEQAIEAAHASARYSASDPNIWSHVSASLTQQLLDSWKSPLLTESDMGTLPEGLMDYYLLLQNKNTTSMEAIKLDTAALDGFSRIIALYHCDRSDEAVVSALTEQIFDSRYFCDTDSDLIPDQVSTSNGVSFGNTWNFEQNGSVTLTLSQRAFYYSAQIAVQCDDPQSIIILDPSGTPIPGTVSDGIWTASIPQSEYAPEFSLTIQSSSPQQISLLTIMTE